MDVRKLLDRKKNPFFEHAEAEYFLAERSGRVVGRIAAIANRLHNETHQDKVGFFGFFECEYDEGAIHALFAAATEWVRARGFDTLRGPASFSVNDECGLLVDGYDTAAHPDDAAQSSLVSAGNRSRRIQEGQGPAGVPRRIRGVAMSRSPSGWREAPS